MSASIPSVDDMSRPAKALIDGGVVADFGDAAAILAASAPTVIAGPDAVSYGHQAALLTAVETACRAFEQVRVHIAPEVATARCVLPGMTDLTLADTVVEAGGQLVGSNEAFNGSGPMIVIGALATRRDLMLQVTWDQWVAHVDTVGGRLPERGNMVLAPVAAAALAVTECFLRALGIEEACYRRRSLNLWRPDLSFRAPQHPTLDEDVLGPDLRYLPASVWMVGLGHLGQAYAWCWRMLPYLDPPECEIQLQDFDKVTTANHTTGMLIRPSDIGTLKTRVAASALERAGFTTRIVERRLLPDTRLHEKEPALALIGVDKLAPRRIISDVGWKFAVDVGLGAGPVDFTGVSIHTFPAPTSSHDVAAWQRDPSLERAARAHQQEAYRSALSGGADACGLIQLAETAVAAPFVGVVGACLALAEPLRVLHGLGPNITVAYDTRRTGAPRSTEGSASPRIAYVPARTSSPHPRRRAPTAAAGL